MAKEVKEDKTKEEVISEGTHKKKEFIMHDWWNSSYYCSYCSRMFYVFEKRWTRSIFI